MTKPPQADALRPNAEPIGAGACTALPGPRRALRFAWRALCWAVGLTLVLVALFVGFIWWVFQPPGRNPDDYAIFSTRKFDRAAWLAVAPTDYPGQLDCIRPHAEMAQDVVKNHLKVGMTEGPARGVVGEEMVSKMENRRMPIYLGECTGRLPFQQEVEIRFHESKDRVVSVTLRL